jgi:hypothetical protein
MDFAQQACRWTDAVSPLAALVVMGGLGFAILAERGVSD